DGTLARKLWRLPTRSSRFGITTVALQASQQRPSFTGWALLPYPPIASPQIEHVSANMATSANGR
ncbi:MAG TPA: hypothetical protein VKB76_10285, partial [Ktedonobacterales bacterium]|nr:hypothetical protein [Ktedonobacterales bacterium]